MLYRRALCAKRSLLGLTWLALECRLPVPNMIADLDQAPKERVEKPVWRVAFFGRLEERKGIKLFVDAVQVRAHARTCSHMVYT